MPVPTDARTHLAVTYDAESALARAWIDAQAAGEWQLPAGPEAPTGGPPLEIGDDKEPAALSASASGSSTTGLRPVQARPKMESSRAVARSVGLRSGPDSASHPGAARNATVRLAQP